MDSSLRPFIEGMPKIELHLHIEGTMEPEMVWELAQRNDIALLNRQEKPFKNVGEVKKAYESFDGLDDFLPLYLQGVKVLTKEQDFHDLTYAYLKKVAGQNVKHTEIFFDPQAHTLRGIDFKTAINGVARALKDGERKLGISSRLIMCFMRDRSEEEAFETLKQAKPYIEKGLIHGIGLDYGEANNPPSKFARVYAEAKKLYPHLRLVAHAGEEGPASYVSEALDLLKVDRVDHGDNSLDDPALVKRLVKEKMGLTVCPVCKVKIKGIKQMTDHKLKKMLALGIKASVNSDDPGYFQAYMNENLIEVAEALNLKKEDIIQLARNAIEISSLSSKEKQQKTQELDAYVAKTSEMTDTGKDYVGNTEFYDDYAKYLVEPRVRKVHDAVFNAIKVHPAFQRVIDLGCGKGNEFCHYGKPDFYLGIDQNADIVNDEHRVTERLDYRHLDAIKARIKDHGLTGVISLFSTEPTKPRDDNNAFYEALFRDTDVNAILVSGFYYKDKKGQETVKEEKAGVTSYQTSGDIDRPDAKLFHETRVEIPCPSNLFGEQPVEVYRLLQRPGHYDAASAEALMRLAPEGYLAETRMALGYARNVGEVKVSERLRSR